MILHTTESAVKYQHTQAVEVGDRVIKALVKVGNESAAKGMPEDRAVWLAQQAEDLVNAATEVFKVIKDDYVLIKRTDLDDWPKVMDALVQSETAAGRYDPNNAMVASPYQTLDFSQHLIDSLYSDINS